MKASTFSTEPIVAYVHREWKARFGYDKMPAWGEVVYDVCGDSRALNVAGVKVMPERMTWGAIDTFCVRVLKMHPANLYPNWFDVSLRDASESYKTTRSEKQLERQERAASLAAKRQGSASSQAAANLAAPRCVV